MANLMKQSIFIDRIKAKKLALFSKRDIQVLFKTSETSAIFLLYRYNKNGIILKIKRGLYCLKDTVPPEVYLSSKLYTPSYISREFALSYHGIIPETVYEITAVTTKTTRIFKTLKTVYSYRHIKKTAFTGYELKKQNGYTFYIADIEKAFADTLYYALLFDKKHIERFNKEKINKRKTLAYAKLFNNQKLIDIVNKLL